MNSPLPPVIEIDWAVPAAYIRFKEGKVFRTVERDFDTCCITVDFDEAGAVIGVECIGEAREEIRHADAQRS